MFQNARAKKNYKKEFKKRVNKWNYYKKSRSA